MTTATEICNQALSFIRVDRINDFDTDTTRRAIECRTHFADARDEVLAELPWNFATKRVALASTTTPAFEWSYAFSIPDDLIRVIDTNLDVDTEPWEVEGNTIVTDSSAVSIIYTARVTNMALAPVHFRRALAYNLASRLANALTDDLQLAQTMFQAYRDALDTGGPIEGHQRSVRRQPVSDLIDVRFGSATR